MKISSKVYKWYMKGLPEDKIKEKFNYGRKTN